MYRIYRYNPNASYKPNVGNYLQIMSAKDLYIQNITVSEHDNHSDSFQMRFPNVFTNYMNGGMRVEDKKYIAWENYEFTLWQTQLNFAVFCTSSACGVSVEHIHAKILMIRSIYHFYAYYHIRIILKILQIPLPCDNTFQKYNNPYSGEMFMKICREYGVSNDLMKWRNQGYFTTWQSKAWETGRPDMSHIYDNSFSRWIIEKSDGLIKVGLRKLSETVRDYAYLILTIQASTRGPIVGYTAQNLDAKQVFRNTFENIINRRVDIPEDMQRFQKTLQYARGKVDYVIGELIYMLPSDMNLWNGKIKNYNNKILVSSFSFNIGTNLKINLDDSKHLDKDKPDVKPNKPDIKSIKEHKQDIKMIKTKPDMNEITYEKKG